MKRIVILMFLSFALFLGNKVYAESFFKGEYISGEYINKVKNGKTYYLTMQYINDDNENIVYCLEPFVNFENGKSYIKYEDDLTSYKNLTKAQIKQIELIIYYGYGYGTRTSNKWYVITQYLVWKVVDRDADIYFTDKLNGKKVSKYNKEIQELLSNVENHKKTPAFVQEYNVNLGDDLTISGLNNSYEIVSSDYEYFNGTSFNIKNVTKNGNILIRKVSNRYKNKVAIYDSVNSQDVIKPGNVLNDVYTIPIKVTKGDITLEIKDDDSVYTIESSFNNTCYELSSEDVVLEKICTSDSAMTYKTRDLPYGDYIIKQVSNGLGYKKDVNIYEVSINADNSSPVVYLYNYLIKNEAKIVKYACNSGVCEFEVGAQFEILNKNDEIVSVIETDKDGNASKVLGYGSYKLKQIKGYSDYDFSPIWNFKVVDETTSIINKLYNYYLERDVEDVEVVPEVEDEPSIMEIPVENEEIGDVPVEVEELPPKTRVDSFNIIEFLEDVYLFVKGVIFDFLKLF